MSHRSLYPWYAIRTRSNYEKITAAILEARGFEQYLPLCRHRKRWSDRTVESAVPLFPGYVFSRFDARVCAPIVSTPGVLSIVGFGGRLATIDDQEIEAIHAVLNSGYPAKECPFISEGQRVRITRGSLRGIEGILITKRTWRLILSIEMLCRSIAIEIEPDSVNAI